MFSWSEVWFQAHLDLGIELIVRVQELYAAVGVVMTGVRWQFVSLGVALGLCRLITLTLVNVQPFVCWRKRQADTRPSSGWALRNQHIRGALHAASTIGVTSQITGHRAFL
ncbi:hypothetical protein CONLIGDRAFT_637729 [Coniochaeta ligniaria NRRL 30616]|uniref:Uncharacterized protein n=1 Tax=Coniochaeta ligniaria NRRL 30616 TaxID=1408157 RepID=A0A1J7J703_9PEZI|nr:hypothetical protein CONLIGDRAFT_637729 [Coniochaeta ligniaria NRRL 30616]